MREFRKKSNEGERIFQSLFSMMKSDSIVKHNFESLNCENLDGRGGKMSKFEMNIGAKIHCKDGDCGKLDKFVFDPYTDEITDLVVSEGILFKTDRVIPAGRIERTAPEDIFLTIEREQFEDFPKYREIEYEIIEDTPPGLKGKSATQSLTRANPYGVPASRPFFPTIMRRKVQQNVSPDAQVLERGTDVLDRNKHKIGTLNHMLLDQETCKVTHIIVDRGTAGDAKVIPESMLEVVSEDNIILYASQEEVLDLPSYIPRGDEHILTEAQEYLKERIKQDGMRISVDRGIMQLSGYVHNIMEKRQTEAAARSIRGVIDVENNLRTDTTIQAKVTATLHTDKRTELSLIQVESEYGIVTLKGVADDREIAQTAETIASLQPGVNVVMNEIAIEQDEFTPYLQNRLGWELEKAKEMSYFPGG
jgi:uncharacterized protein YrrD